MTTQKRVSLAVWLLMTACGAVVGSRYVKSATIDAAQGGSIAVSATDSQALAGARLDIPAGALGQTATITVEPALQPLVADADGVSPATVWGPSGLKFSTPATMTLPVSLAAGDVASELEVVVEEADGTVKAIATVTLDTSRTRASFQVTGFSTFQVRRHHHACHANADCATGQVCASGTCYASQNDGGVFGACTTDADCATAEACIAGVCALRCSQAAEVCGDGLDNNCNGIIDEGCTPTDGGSMSCISSADCATGEMCVSGTCRTPPPLDGGVDGGVDGGLFCRTDTDCGVGGVCASGVCAFPPNDGGIDGGDLDAGPNCSSNADCATGQICLNNFCQLQCVPSIEVCNGIDDDCDGIVDNNCIVIDGGIDAGPFDAGSDAGADAGSADAGPFQDAGSKTCRADFDCASGQVCFNGVCQ